MTIQIRPFLHLPPPGSFASFSDVVSYTRRLWDSLYQTRRGHIECTVMLTLTANAASTVLSDPRLSTQSSLSFDPITANAATEKAAGTLYALEAGRGTGAVTITHANNGQTDRTYIVKILG